MTTAQKLEKLVEAALKNGWKETSHPEEVARQIVARLDHEQWIALIYKHAFLKALFGEEFKSYTIAWYKLEGEHMKDPDDFVAQHHYIKAWEFYGMQALISSDPVDYLYKQAIGGEDER